MLSSDHTTKHCPKCGQDYPLTSEFWYKDKTRKDNFYVNCKTCESCRRKKERGENPEQRKIVTQRYLVKHPDKRKESVKRYCDANREKLNEYNKTYRQTHSESVREYGRKKSKELREARPEIKREHERRRRVRKANADGNHTAEETKQLYVQQNGKCFHCEVELNDKYHEDHWIPLSKGGSDWISNIRLLCPKCNLSKKDKLPHEWSDRYR